MSMPWAPLGHRDQHTLYRYRFMYSILYIYVHLEVISRHQSSLAACPFLRCTTCTAFNQVGKRISRAGILGYTGSCQFLLDQELTRCLDWVVCPANMQQRLGSCWLSFVLGAVCGGVLYGLSVRLVSPKAVHAVGKHAQRTAEQPVVSVDHTYTFVLGIVCSERQHAWRARLRRLYGRHAGVMRPVFVIAADRQADARWQEREVTIGGRVAGDILYANQSWWATHVYRRVHVYREAHCAHKTMVWWQTASRWPSKWYGKTDDDAVIDLPALLSLLDSLPAGPVYGGIVRYSSLNSTTLEGECFSSGGNGAVNKRRFGRGAAYCASLEGPFPYVEGPLEIVSSDVQQFLSTRVERDARMRCHYEDLYVGWYMSRHPRLSLINLDSLLGRKDVYDAGRNLFVGADSFVAHWVRKDDAFEAVSAAFERAHSRSTASYAVGCSRWADSFANLRYFPCCQEWSICEPRTPLLRARGNGPGWRIGPYSSPTTGMVDLRHP